MPGSSAVAPGASPLRRAQCGETQAAPSGASVAVAADTEESSCWQHEPVQVQRASTPVSAQQQ
jgi:hypothetical protein